LAYSVGLLPTKDVFWSSQTQPDYIHGGHQQPASEPNPGMTTLLTTLSCGQVAPGDWIGGLNATLLLRTCSADGRLLRPDRPAYVVVVVVVVVVL
jgi:hypothetical protein